MESYKKRLIEAGWIVDDMGPVWRAKKNRVSIVASLAGIRIHGERVKSWTPREVFDQGQLNLPENIGPEGLELCRLVDAPKV